MAVERPARVVYGLALGIIMHQDNLVRVPGDVGNATTFPFPVLYEVVTEVAAADLQDPEAKPRVLEAFQTAARRLESQGVRAILAGCGFASILQVDLARVVQVPVFTSSLLQVPWIAGCLPPGARIGIVTADDRVLDDRYFAPLGWSSSSVAIAVGGLNRIPEFLELLRSDPCRHQQRMGALVAGLAESMLQGYPDIGAFVLECTNLPPYADAIARQTGRPVFDIVSLGHWAYRAVVPAPYPGHL